MERAESVVDGALSPEDLAGWRVALSPHLFRGMLVGMAAVAIGLHRTTGSRELAWQFAKARARTLTWLLGVGVTVDDLVRALRFIVATPSYTGDTIIVDSGEHLTGRPRDIAFDLKKKK